MLRIEFKQFAMRVRRRTAGNVKVNCGNVLMFDFPKAVMFPLVIPAKAAIHLAFDLPRLYGFPPSRE